MAPGCRGWVFTLNNWNKEDLARLGSIDVKYILYGKEKCPSTGTPHLQGMLYLHLQKTLPAVKAWLGLPRVHLEPMADIDKSIIYCKKDGQFYERGVAPKSQKLKGELGGAASKLRWIHTLDCAKRGRHDLIDPQLQITQCRNIDYVYVKELNRVNLRDTTYPMLWLYGKTGTGKSRAAREVFAGDIHDKMCNKWFNGYTNQRVCLMEDIDLSHAWLLHHMKIWGDRYMFSGEIKGGVIMIRPLMFVVTSNFHPNEIWHNPADVEPILRRFTCLNYVAGEELPLLSAYRLPPLATTTPHAITPENSPDSDGESEPFRHMSEEESDGSQAIEDNRVHWDDDCEQIYFDDDDDDAGDCDDIGSSSSDTQPMDLDFDDDTNEVRHASELRRHQRMEHVPEHPKWVDEDFATQETDN